jgi:superfamily I DNA/RNA helicase
MGVAVKLLHLKGRGLPTDTLIIDEAQDMSRVMRGIIDDTVSTGARLIAVGDGAQAINGWNGAIDALGHFAAMDGAESVRLSRSFRFGEAIANYANGVLDLIDAPSLIGCGPKISPFNGYKPYTVVTRSNGGAIAKLIDLIDSGVSVGISDKVSAACGSILTAADTFLKTGKSDHHELEGLKREDLDEYLGFLSQDMQFALNLAGNPKINVPQVVDAVQRARRMDNPQATITTAHSGKGGEWDQVTLTNDYKAVDDEGSVDPDEAMVLYVAITRAKQSIILSESAWMAVEAGNRKGARRNKTRL